MRHRRWSDNDRYWGPFTVSKNSPEHRPMGIILVSGNYDENRCELMTHWYWVTIIIALPQIIKPYVTYIKAHDNISYRKVRLIPDYHNKRYGFNLLGNFLQVHYGYGDKRQWSCFLPWSEWRHIRHTIYDTNGNVFWEEGSEAKVMNVKDWIEAKDTCPSIRFTFEDYDGEIITARTYIEEREWKAGTGWFKWLSWFKKNKIHRSLDIEFSSEVGSRKGSWKGGTIGHSIEMEPGEWHESAFKRYCETYNLKFIGETNEDLD